MSLPDDDVTGAQFMRAVNRINDLGRRVDAVAGSIAVLSHRLDSIERAVPLEWREAVHNARPAAQRSRQRPAP